METLLSIVVAIGLSAACGFRVFVPLLAMNIASISGQLHLSPEFAWIGSWYATVAFGVATVIEILAYYISWLDNALDVIATPAAIIAGTITTASMVTDMSPFLKWTLALITGGGAAGIVQGATVALRAKSSIATGGVGNPLIASLELVGSITTVLLAFVVPILCLVLVAVLCVFSISKTSRHVFRKRSNNKVR